jgi:clan AA aspartic protease (TIGR02281 family)
MHSLARTLSAVLVVGLAMAAITAAAVAETVQLEREHGVFMVPVRINDAVTIPFVLDSGAGDVSVPEDVFKTLLRTRTVTESDFLPPGTYVMADGSRRSNQRFTLHELRVGDYVIRDIVASVAPDKADPLLGQSFLGKLPGWAIDNTKHTLVIGAGGDARRPQTAPTAPASPGMTRPAKSILAGDLQNAQNAIGAVLQKDGGGLVANRSSFPSLNLLDRSNDGWEYIASTHVVPINGMDNAILIDSTMCNGGNGHGQYLVIMQKGSARVITNAEIADMSFIGRIGWVDGTSVFLTGHRWDPSDPHCCPSREATLEYDIRTGQHKFILGKKLQSQ